MKLQSVANSLNHIDPKKVPGFEEIQECLNEAEKSLSGALRGPRLRSGTNKATAKACSLGLH